MDNLRFTIPEILSLLGVAQSVYLLVYMLFRSGSFKSIILPSCYFIILAAAFSFDFAQHSVSSLIPAFPVWQALLWFMGPPLSVLLIIQILNLPALPSVRHLWVLGLMPVAVFLSYMLARRDEYCTSWTNCSGLEEWLIVFGLMAGVFSIFAIWGQRHKLESLHQEKAGRDRYWLILTLVFMNLFFLGLMLFSLTRFVGPDEVVLIRNLMGLGFVYIAGTSLFRIYPQAVLLIQKQERRDTASRPQDEELANRIRELMDTQKIYQESDCNRASLARELGVPEGALSRVINAVFGKTVPQFLNERRVQDAQQLLRDTDAPVKVIAEEVGFSSLASFNRVFKEISGESPSTFRATCSNHNTANK